MRRRLALISLWIILFALAPVRLAWAYIDPATTTYLIQIMTALIITLGVTLSIFIYRFQMIVTNVKVVLHAFTKRVGRRQGTKATASEENNQKGFLSEEEALAAGIIDYPIPVRESYPALSLYVPYDEKPSVEEQAESGARTRGLQGWLRRFGTWLWGDERTFKKRLPVALLIAGGLAVTYLIFPIIDSAITNAAEMPFSLAEVIWIILALGLLAFVVVTLLLAVLRGRLFDLAVCLALSFLLCGYLQITFFNSGIGQLIGSPLGWEELGLSSVLINAAAWLVIFALVLLFGLMRRERYQRFFRRAALFIPVLIIAAQLVALLSIYPSANPWNTPGRGGAEHRSEDLYLTWDGITEVSENENIIFIILDAFDERYVDAILAEDPGFFDNLDGFTYFRNNVAAWNSTYPSVINYMTGAPFDSRTLRTVYTAEAYEQGTFVSDIREQGFSANIYMENPHCYNDGATQLVGVADNLHTVSYTIDIPYAIKQLMKLNVLKLSPHAFKNSFWIPPDYFNFSMVYDESDDAQSEGARIYMADDLKFYDEVLGGLTIIEGPGHFTYIHLRGSHVPYTINAQAQLEEEGKGSAVEQTKGCFLILNEYFRQLKALGVYKDATIIITGDHPEHVMHKLLDRAQPVGLLVKPAGSEGVPLQVSNAPVSIDNLQATCVAAAGGDASKWGRTYFEVGEDEAVVRYYRHRYTTGNGEYVTAVFRITGDANDWSNWELVEEIVEGVDFWF